MKYLSNILFLTIAMACTSLFSQVAFQDIEPDSALKLSQHTGQKLLIDIYTDWCVPCKELDKHIFSQPKVGKFVNENYISIKLNAEEPGGKLFCKTYEIPEAYPTVLLLDEKANEIDRIIGLIPEEKYIQILRDYPKRSSIMVSNRCESLSTRRPY
ncbi:MAG: thioredoxin family protein [Bacteroidota bacterium]